VSASSNLDVPAGPVATVGRALGAALVTTIVVTALAWLAPDRHAATLVGLAFLGATWWLVLRGDERLIRRHGLSLGGVLEPTRLESRRVMRSAVVAIAWAMLFALLVFPPFFFGYRAYFGVKSAFHWRAPASLLDDVAGQLFVIALPEEAFFRGYLQTALDEAFTRRVRVLGADLGVGWFLSAVIFAIGHFLTQPHPSRLAVFFPALLFGWLRARTGGIGGGVVLHASCNLVSATLARGFGFAA